MSNFFLQCNPIVLKYLLLSLQVNMITHSTICPFVQTIFILQKKRNSLSFIEIWILGLLQLQSNFNSKNVCLPCNYEKVCAIIKEPKNYSTASNQTILMWTGCRLWTRQRSIQIIISLDQCSNKLFYSYHEDSLWDHNTKPMPLDHHVTSCPNDMSDIHWNECPCKTIPWKVGVVEKKRYLA